MTPPVALAYLAAGTGMIGAVNGTMGTVNAAESGVHIGRSEVQYPKEFPRNSSHTQDSPSSMTWSSFTPRVRSTTTTWRWR